MQVMGICLVFLYFFVSCDTVREEYLYDESDPEYSDLILLEAQQCIDDSNIFDSLDSSGSFETSGHLDKIYKITQDDNSALKLYIKITAVSATSMTFVVNSIDTQYQKIMAFEKTDHDNLLALIKTAACNSNYKSLFSASGLDSTSSMALTWSKETIETADSNDDSDENAEGYKRQTDVYTFDSSYPLLFFFYNATKTTNILLDDGDIDTDDETQKVSEVTIEDVTSADECVEGGGSQNNGCKFEASDISGFANCNVEVSTTAFSSNSYDSELVSLAATSGTCQLLRSAGN